MLLAFLVLAGSSGSSSNSLKVFGVTVPPTQKPILMGSFPYFGYSFCRISSAAKIILVIRSLCCVVSRRKVYRKIAVTPPSRLYSSFSSARSLLFAITNAIRPRYASVLPPPVGKYRRSTTSRLSCSGSTIPFRFMRIKAIWKGLQPKLLEGLRGSTKSLKAHSIPAPCFLEKFIIFL